MVVLAEAEEGRIVTRTFAAGFRWMAIVLLVLAVLTAPFALLFASAPANGLSIPCGPAAEHCGGTGCTPSGLAAADGTLVSPSCPGGHEAPASDDACTISGCHAMPVTLPTGRAPPPIIRLPVPLAIPALALPASIAVDPASKPPRASL